MRALLLTRCYLSSKGLKNHVIGSAKDVIFLAQSVRLNLYPTVPTP
jgi:hypothetical protein